MSAQRILQRTGQFLLLTVLYLVCFMLGACCGPRRKPHTVQDSVAA